MHCRLKALRGPGSTVVHYGRLGGGGTMGHGRHYGMLKDCSWLEALKRGAAARKWAMALWLSSAAAGRH